MLSHVLENGLEITSKKFDEIEEIHFLEFINNSDLIENSVNINTIPEVQNNIIGLFMGIDNEYIPSIDNNPINNINKR